MTQADTEGTRAARRTPRAGYLWAFALAAGHAALTSLITLGGVSYGAFLPSPLLSGLFQQWLGELVGVLVLMTVLTWTRWWRPTGLTRVRPRADSWTLLPLAALVLAAILVGRLQFGQATSLRLNDLTGSSAPGLLLLIGLSLVAAVLLGLALVPRLLGAGQGREPWEVVVMTGVVIGLATLGSEAVFAAFSPAEQGSPLLDGSLLFLIQALIVQGLLVMPYVAVALRTGAPWLLAPLLLLRLLTVGPVDAYAWAYALLGAAYAIWLATSGPDRTGSPDGPGSPAEVPRRA